MFGLKIEGCLVNVYFENQVIFSKCLYSQTHVIFRKFWASKSTNIKFQKSSNKVLILKSWFKILIYPQIL